MNQIPESFWQYIAITAIAALVSVVGWYARNTREDLKSLQRDHKELNNFVLTNYHPKEDIDKILTDIKDGVTRLHERLDTMFNRHMG